MALPEGKTLRSYLAEKLQCDPMRITKKFAGASCLGKRIHHLCESPQFSRQEIEIAKVEIERLEERFRLRLEHGVGVPLPPPLDPLVSSSVVPIIGGHGQMLSNGTQGGSIQHVQPDVMLNIQASNRLHHHIGQLHVQPTNPDSNGQMNGQPNNLQQNFQPVISMSSGLPNFSQFAFSMPPNTTTNAPGHPAPTLMDNPSAAAFPASSYLAALTSNALLAATINSSAGPAASNSTGQSPPVTVMASVVHQQQVPQEATAPPSQTPATHIQSLPPAATVMAWPMFFSQNATEAGTSNRTQE